MHGPVLWRGAMTTGGDLTTGILTIETGVITMPGTAHTPPIMAGATAGHIAIQMVLVVTRTAVAEAMLQVAADDIVVAVEPTAAVAEVQATVAVAV